MWTCDKCNEVFHNKLNVLKHRRIHSFYRPYKCHFGHCIKTFSSLSALQRHRRQHCDHRLYQCGVCGVGFLQQFHLVRHNCQSRYRRNFRCHSCAAVFSRILSLANHIRAQHPRLSQYRNGLKNTLTRLKKTKAAKSDDSKILLKIKAGKSMTIISPTKNPPGNDSKKRHGKKKSKKKHRKEEKETERRGIILSIKKGTVNVSDKKIKEKGVSEKHSGRINGLVKPEYKLSEQKSDLKLTIKTCPDLTHLNASKEVYKLSDKSENAFTSSHVSVKKTHSLSDIDQIVKSGYETNSYNESDETKCRNGIVITKDKSGKFLAEQLQSSKMKKKDRDNVFDSFGDVGLWKVMPSPRTDRPVDVLKLKLSPHKPVRLEPTEDTCNYQASKYLDIPINIGKVKSDASGEDSDVMVSSPAFDKESDGGINNVNDSGIEVLSSSSCNRSNGNSVRSVALEDNSPTYFQAEDSLLSLDSPFTDSLNKSEHSICHKCGGIILEANNNTRSPGKCRCNFSNPNSPFQTPVSPLKSSAQLADSVKSQDSVYSLAHKSLSSLDSVEKGKTDGGMPCEPLTISEKSEVEENDVMIINPDGSVPNSDRKTKLKLKLRPKDVTASPVKDNKKCSPKSKLNKIKSYGFVPEHESEKELKVKSEDLEIVRIGVQTNESNMCENSSTKLEHSSNNECNMPVVQKVTKDSSVNKETFSDVIVIDDEVEVDNCDTKHGGTVPTICANSTPEDASHVRKKPLFKCKKQQEKSESQLVNTTKQLTETVCNNPREKPVAKKKPLFKKRTTSADENVGTKTRVPLVKKQVSVPGTFKDVEMELFASSSGDIPKKETSCVKNREKSPEHVSVNLKAAKEICITNVDEDDSLQTFPDVPVVEPPPQGVRKTPSTPLDLFQQQFLSFISNSINSNKQDLNIDMDNASLDDVESVSTENIELKDCADTEDKTSSESTKKSKKSAAVNSHSGKSVLQKDIKQTLNYNSVSKAKNGGSKVANKKVVKNVTQTKSAKMNENVVVSEQKVENAKSDDDSVDLELGSGDVSKTDSFSWLKIFSSSEQSGKDSVTAQEISKDVMADLSENLAEINKKMDVSEDDDSNSLDMDNVFEVGHLSSLEPKTSFQFNVNKSTSSNSKTVTTQASTSHGNGKPYTRRQTAKRTIGRFKSVKRKTESDEEYCNNCSDAISDSCIHDSDPEYDPSVDSGDDHVKRRNFVNKRCLPLKHTHSFDSTDSENESRASESERHDTDVHSSRSRRLKKGRRSCCPCCIGSPRKRSSSQTQTHSNTYKLPPRHKQFVRNTLRLLEIQEKIHTLFLTLFPECADLIMCSKVGTDDFEVLIDEVVSSLEKNPANSALQNGELNVDSRIEQQYNACAMNNIGMPFTTPDSASRSCEIDEKEQKTLCANVDKNGSANANLTVETNTCTEKASATIEHSGKPFDTGTLWQHPALINQTSLTSSSNSSSSLKFENNTLNDCDDEPIQEVTNDNVVSLISTSNTFNTVSQVAEASNSSDILSNSLDDKKVQIVNHVNGVEFLGSAEQYSELGYFTPVVPAVQNEITITLDLNAVRVTLCRNPKQCLQRLHNQIIKLSKCLLPRLSFKNYFYRNIDNLEFLLDLMLESNMHNIPVDSEEEVVLSEPEEEVTNWPDIIQNKLEILEPPLIQETDTVQVNFFSSETNSKSEERESLFVKCSDLFEQQIKSQREFLKKDVFSVEDDRIENSDWKSTQDVLNSIHSINKMAQRRRVGRPRRDSRLRKRSADEKRTLFVQEKLLNSQNSTFVCDKPIRTRPNGKSKAGRKRMRRESSKEKFLSELNLGDIQTEMLPTVEEKTRPSGRKRLKLSCSNNPVMVESAGKETNSTANVNDVGETECTELNPLDMCNELGVKVDMDSGLKSPDKNIFELMQPS